MDINESILCMFLAGFHNITAISILLISQIKYATGSNNAKDLWADGKPPSAALFQDVNYERSLKILCIEIQIT